MSILAFVLDPQSDEERAFSVPVASEAVFKTRWLPVVEGLELQWLPLFSMGADIQQQDKEAVLNELRAFRAACAERYGMDEVIDRIDMLVRALQQLSMTRRGLVVHIG